MPRLVAFLRAINVGGHVVGMKALRQHLEAMGFGDVETFIASGNVVFSTQARDHAKLERRIEAHLRERLGYEVKTFVRTASEVAAVAAYTPFEEADLLSAHAVHVGFMASPLDAQGKQLLMALRTDIDAFHVNGREVYWLCKQRQSESTFSNVAFEKALKVGVTFRTSRTIARLAAKYAFEP
jgi:uncharacterized protein (DUF1697 family)